jgi:hypothetical protein
MEENINIKRMPLLCTVYLTAPKGGLPNICLQISSPAPIPSPTIVDGSFPAVGEGGRTLQSTCGASPSYPSTYSYKNVSTYSRGSGRGNLKMNAAEISPLEQFR